MDRWANKVAVVTGASAGIGAQICRDLCARNIVVAGLARRGDVLKELGQDIRRENPLAQFHEFVCDVAEEDQIKATFEQVIDKLGGVDILVNNAGIFPNASLLEEGVEEKLNQCIQININAVISCTRKAYKSMADRDAMGLIVNLSSIAGHTVMNMPPGIKPFPGIYYAAKHALTAFNRGLGQELVYYKKPNIRVCNISPGPVRTDIFRVGGFGEAFEEIPQLSSKDVSDVLLFILSMPNHVQIRDVIMENSATAYF